MPYSGYGTQNNYGLQQPINALIRVTGIEGAKAYRMPANSVIPLFDGNEDILYVKSTDGAGFPTIRQFRFEEIVQQPQVQSDIYATKDDVAQLTS